MLNKVVEGDCLEVMKDIPDKSIDMILCDLPYGTTQNEWDSVIPLERLWEQYERALPYWKKLGAACDGNIPHLGRAFFSISAFSA